MGQRGPGKTPTKLNVLRGNPGKRSVPKNEVQPPPGDPEPPDILQGESRQEWFRLIPALIANGLYTQADQTALIIYCDMRAMYIEAMRQCAAIEVVAKSKRGAGRMSPWFQVRMKTAEKVRQYLKDFGLSPSLRAGLVGEHEHEADEFSEWKNGKGVKRK